MMEVMDESDLERELEEADKVNTSTTKLLISLSTIKGQNVCRHLSRRSLGIWWGLALASVPPSFLW